MENFVHNIGQVLGTTILHSLWQGLLIYTVIRLAFIAFPAAGAGRKYKVLYLALIAMVFWFGYTFFMEAKTYNWTTPIEQHFNLPDGVAMLGIDTPVPTLPAEQPFYYKYKPLLNICLPYVSALYLLSVLINVFRLALGWQKIRVIKKRAVAATQWQTLTNQLTTRAGVAKNVQIYFSQLVNVPCAMGYLKPVLLLPVTIGTQLTAEEIEVIILHELAHKK